MLNLERRRRARSADIQLIIELRISGYASSAVEVLSFLISNLSVLFRILIQHTFCTRNFPFSSCNRTGRHSQGHSKSFKCAFRPVVIIIPPQAIDMHRNTRMQRKAFQAMRQHLTAQISNLLPLCPEINNRVWSITQIHHRSRQSLVQWGIGISKSCQAGGRLQSRFEGLSERYTGVFGGVMVVYV